MVVHVLAHYALYPLPALSRLLLALLVYHLVLILELTHQLLDPLPLRLACLPSLHHVALALVEPLQDLPHGRTLRLLDLGVEGASVALRRHV